MKRFLMLFTSLLLLVGCTKAVAYEALTSTKGSLRSDHSITQLDQGVHDYSNAFAFDLLETLFLQDSDKNIVVSPLSIQLALGMTMTGADERTLDQFFDMMHVIDRNAFDHQQKQLQVLLTNRNHATLNINNSLWIRDSFKEYVLADYLDRVVENYGALVATGDFDDMAMVDSINRWVKDTTNKKIDKALDGPIDPLTVMFLINTIYLKADWLSAFDPNQNIQENFYGSSTNRITYMNQILDAMAYVEDDLAYIELPYKDQDLKMVIILDKDQPTTLKQYRELKNKASLKSVDLFLPKFKIETEISMNQPLIDMGMQDAFLPDTADFSRIAENAKAMGLHIADVLHKTFIQVDEKGTEAAAMTKVEMRLESMPHSDIILKIDRPFTMLLVDTKLDVITFMGFIFDLQN